MFVNSSEGQVIVQDLSKRLVSQLALASRQIRSIMMIATTILPILYIPSALTRFWLLDIEQRSLLPAIVSLPAVFMLVLIGCLVGWIWLKGRA